MHVVSDLCALIESGSPRPGEKLQPEREFAHSLCASRAILRTGIGYLAARRRLYLLTEAFARIPPSHTRCEPVT